LTNKPTARDLLPGNDLEANIQSSCPSPLLVAAFWNDDLQGQSRSIWAAKMLAQETTKSFHYVGVGLAVLGLWWQRRRLSVEPALWLLVVLATAHAVILWRMACIKGYVSDRHTLMIVVPGSIWMSAAIVELSTRIAAWRKLNWLPEARATATLTAVLFACCLPTIWKPLHANRAGHHAAGCWMARNITQQDEVIDPFAWASFYSGSKFREGVSTAPPRNRYVVIENSSNLHTRLPLMPMARALAEKGEPVYHWPEKQSPDQAIVIVYRVPVEH
jgi:hypothetical protein